MNITNCQVVELVLRSSGGRFTLGRTVGTEVTGKRDDAVEVVISTVEVVSVTATEVGAVAAAEVVDICEGGGEVRWTSGDCNLAATSGVGSRGFAASSSARSIC